MTTSIGDLEPNVTMNFSSYQPYLDRYHHFEFEVSTSNGFRIVCEMNGKKLYSDLVNQSAHFNITEVSQPITFSSICANNSERACLIKYPTPNETGYHLLRYPDRDGISVTGRGFLTEFIYVEKGKSFFYSKTYLGEIEILKEYSLTDQVSVKIKITDNKADNYTITQNSHHNLLLQDNDDAIYLSKTRKICLVDKSNDDILPFSRKNFDENLFDMLDRLGIDSNGDLRKLTNDENGCLIFDPELIKSNKFDRLTNDFCDLPLVTDIKDVDRSDIIFEKSGSSKSDKIKRILILVAIIVVCVIIIIVIIVCSIKKRCCCCCCGDGGIEDISP